MYAPFRLILFFCCLPPTVTLNATADAALGAFICATPCGAANNTPITGALTSSLNTALFAATSAAPPSAPAKFSVLLNAASGALSFITLTGAWLADAPLFISPQTVIMLGDGASVTATPTLAAAPTPAVFFANGSFSALVAPAGVAGGARVACGYLPVHGAFAYGAPNFVVDGVAFEQCGGTRATTCLGAISFAGRPMNSGGGVVRCTITDPCRAVWVKAFTRLFVHGNTVLNSSTHAIDFDSFSGTSVVHGNNVSGAAQEAVFLEQGSSSVIVAGNVFTSAARGVALYNYQFNTAMSSHVIFNNSFARCGVAMQVGSTANVAGSGTNWTGAVGTSFFGNVLDSSNGVGIHTQGPQSGTLFFDNVDPVGFSMAALALVGSVTAFDPLGRAINASAQPPLAAPTLVATPSPALSASAAPAVSLPPASSTAPDACMGAAGAGAAATGSASLTAPGPAFLWLTVGFALGAAATMGSAQLGVWRAAARARNTRAELTAAPCAGAEALSIARREGGFA